VSLEKNAIVQAEDPASLLNAIPYGPELPPPPFTSGRTRMPGFGKRLSGEDVAAVASYLRSHFSNRASGVSSVQVTKHR
jgi:mono/diheme cytochrome c family protein